MGMADFGWGHPPCQNNNTADRTVIERDAIDPRTGQTGWRNLEAWSGEYANGLPSELLPI